MTPLVIAGSGGLAREAAEVVHAINASRRTWDLIGFLDDDPARVGTLVDALPVVGPIDVRGDRTCASVLVATGSPRDFGSRRRIVERLGLPARRYATIVHPAAHLALSVDIGIGSLLLAGVVATARASIGAHVAVMPHVVLTHDDVIGDYATIAAGARIAGGVVVEPGAYLGAGCLIRENLVIGAGAMVAMGAVVTHDVPAGELWVGVPARCAGSAPGATGTASHTAAMPMAVAR